jgi:Arc/MetJ family transcription regulator
METVMRTNIILDDDLIQRARQITGIKTKREVVQEALRILIQLHEQSDVRKLRGKLLWEGNLDEQRIARLPEE